MNKPTYFLFRFFLFCCALTLTGCEKIGIHFPQSGAVPPGGLLFEDDFSHPPNGWGSMETRGGEIEFNYDGMMISIFLPNFMYWSVNGKEFNDVKVKVDAVLADGPQDDTFGVICRFQDDRNFYGFVLSHDGYYGVFKYVDGKMKVLSNEGNLGFSEAIRTGGVVNHLEATCERNVLRLRANETLLTEVMDDQFESGKVGLIAGAYSEPGVRVFFDNFKVFQP